MCHEKPEINEKETEIVNRMAVATRKWAIKWPNSLRSASPLAVGRRNSTRRLMLISIASNLPIVNKHSVYYALFDLWPHWSFANNMLGEKLPKFGLKTFKFSRNCEHDLNCTSTLAKIQWGNKWSCNSVQWILGWEICSSQNASDSSIIYILTSRVKRLRNNFKY